MPFDSVSKMGPTSWPHLSELAPWFNHKLALPGKPLIFNFFIRGVVSQKSNHSNNSMVNGELALQITGGAVATEVYNQAWAEAQRVEAF